jgi:isoquinoline 1-oxidoreductase beta subunit
MNQILEKFSISRRGFLVTGAAVGGGFLLGVGTGSGEGPIPAALAHDGETHGKILLNARIAIDTDGLVTILVPRTEMGQGVYTSLPMLAAEELDVDIENVRAEAAPVGDEYVNYGAIMAEVKVADIPSTGGLMRFMIKNVMGMQMTGGSSSVRDGWNSMRFAGAAARHMLRAAGAKALGVDFSETTTEPGFVVHKGSNRRLSYGELADAAANGSPPSNPEFRDSANFRYIGTSVPRLDAEAKSTGTAEFGIDVKLPGMAIATVRNTPVFGGWVKAYDGRTVQAMPGVEKILEVPGGVAVVADTYWHAKTAADALELEFETDGNHTVSSDTIFAQYARDLDNDNGKDLHEEGDVAEALASADDILEAEYRVPFLAHATMEPQNCTALVTGEACEIWIGTQVPDFVRNSAAKLTGLSADRVQVHVKFLGGGFGRRLEVDVAKQAVTVAMAMKGRPVKLIWSREEDMQHDMYRPAALSRFRAILDGRGRPKAVEHRVALPPTFGQFAARNMGWFAGKMGGFGDAIEIGEALNWRYKTPDLLVNWVPSETPVPLGNWRSVSNSYAGFFNEVFLDELAAKAGTDPIDYRIALLGNDPRHQAVLEKLRDVSDWSAELGPGRGRGVAIHQCFESIVGEVAEVTVTDGQLKIDRVIAVVDCGLAINPGIVEQQSESGIIYGLTAALFGEISVDGGRVEQNNFPDYEMIRMANVPKIETHILESGTFLGGMGEPSTPPAAPALINAIFDATGVRHRTLPLSNAEGLSV